MSKELRTLLSDISTEAVDATYSYGEKLPGAGYNNLTNPLHTVVYDVKDFIGSIKIQGTLELYPSDNDWVDIDGTEIGLGSDSSLWTTTNSINFSGNFVWLRAAYNLQDGTINSVRYNY